MHQISKLGLLIYMKLNTYIILTNISQQIVNFGNGKRQCIFFIFVFFCLRIQLVFNKEFMFSIQQTLISLLIDTAEVLQKMTFKNNKPNSYYLSNCLSDRPIVHFKIAGRDKGIGHKCFAIPKL